MIRWIFLLRMFEDVFSFEKCRSLPHSNFLSVQQLDFACNHRKQWLIDRYGIAVKEFPEEITESQRKYFDSLSRFTNKITENEDENDFARNISENRSLFDRFITRWTEKQSKFMWKKQKKGQFIKKNRKLRLKRNLDNLPERKSIRKEYRMLNITERNNLHKAMNALKHKFINNISIWDLFTRMHYPNSAPGAHWGPAFLPWHRKFLRQFEVALQKEVPNVALPYWDSTLDFDLPDPSDSILWTDFMLGNGNGYVKIGPFSDWDTSTFMPLSPVPIHKLYRSTGVRSHDRLLSARDVEWIESRKHYQDLTFCHDRTFETMHGLSHAWVGGFMYVVRVSPNDPTFYLHHAFVDYLWERFRIKRQTREQRENDYATNVCDPLQSLNATMIPFNMTNKDGLSNEYTDKWYEYEGVKHCYELEPYCKSEFYFCDRNKWRCKSKVQAGGNCTGFSEYDVCYKSECIDNVCQLARKESNEKIQFKKNFKNTNIVYAKTLLIGNYLKPLNDTRAFVGAYNQMTGEMTRSYIEKNIQYPEIPGMTYIELPKPHADSSPTIKLEARDPYGRYCQPYCFNHTLNEYEVCEPEISIKSEHQYSTNISYIHNRTARRYLEVDLSTQPYTIYAPKIVFACTNKNIYYEEIKNLAKMVRPPSNHDNHVWTRISLESWSKFTYGALKTAEINVKDEETGDIWRSPIYKVQSLNDPNIIFIRVRNPTIFRQGINVHISIMVNNTKQDCITKCMTDYILEDCASFMRLNYDSNFSDEPLYTADDSTMELLGWNMSGHPALWTQKPTFLHFYC